MPNLIDQMVSARFSSIVYPGNAGLEVEDEKGGSTVWSESFASDTAARDDVKGSNRRRRSGPEKFAGPDRKI